MHSKCQKDPTPSRCWAASTDCWRSTGSYLQGSTWYCNASLPLPTPIPNVCAFLCCFNSIHQNWLRHTWFPSFITRRLELTPLDNTRQLFTCDLPPSSSGPQHQTVMIWPVLPAPLKLDLTAGQKCVKLRSKSTTTRNASNASQITQSTTHESQVSNVMCLASVRSVEHWHCYANRVRQWMATYRRCKVDVCTKTHLKSTHSAENVQ